MRHFVQLVVFAVLNGKFFGLAATALVVPFLWEIQSPFSTAHGAFEALEFSITRGVFPLLVLGIIYLTAITVGRLFCGWACPFGMIQDFLSYIPIRKEKLSQSTTSQLKDIKWVILGFSFLLAFLSAYKRNLNQGEFPVGIFSDSPFAVINPASTLFTYIPWLILWKSSALLSIGLTGWIKIALLIAVLAPSVYIPRFFCRYICPLGALLEPLSKFKYLRIYKNPKLAKEDLNKLLSDVCPMGVQQQSDDVDFIDHGGCINCGRCVTEAPKSLYPKWG